MDISRRHFLQYLSNAALLSLINPHLSWAAPKNAFKGYVLSDGFPEKTETTWGPYWDVAHVPSQNPSGVLILNSDFQIAKRLEIPFLGHKYFQNPVNHHELICTERKGYLAARLDIRKNHIENIKAPAGSIFYGHGFYSSDGKSFFATGLDRVKGRGVLFEYQSSSMKLKRTLETGGLYPHDVQVSHDGKNCIIANSGVPKDAKLKYPVSQNVSSRACISVLDYENGKLLNNILTGTICGIAHFSFISKTKIFAVGTPETGNISDPSQALTLDLATGKIENLSHIAGFEKATGELNNPVYIKERESVAFNCSGSKSIFEISLKDKTIINNIPTPSITPLFEFKSGEFVTASAKGGFQKVVFSEGGLENLDKSKPFKFAAGPHFNEIILLT